MPTRGEYIQTGTMHDALRTWYRTECPTCDGTKERGHAFCATCTGLLPGPVWYRLSNTHGAMYNAAWDEAAEEIRRARARIQLRALQQ